MQWTYYGFKIVHNTWVKQQCQCTSIIYSLVIQLQKWEWLMSSPSINITLLWLTINTLNWWIKTDSCGGTGGVVGHEKLATNTCLGQKVMHSSYRSIVANQILTRQFNLSVIVIHDMSKSRTNTHEHCVFPLFLLGLSSQVRVLRKTTCILLLFLSDIGRSFEHRKSTSCKYATCIIRLIGIKHIAT